MSASSVSAPRSGYGRGARVLSLGIATTGLVTFAYFALAAHALSPVEYKRISLVWSIMFVVASVIYRPIEQLLSRTIADRRARGHGGGHNLRVALLIQAAFALGFLAAALLLRDLLQDDLFDGSAALYWVLVVGVLAYAASYFARGFLAGHQRFELYGLLVFLEAISRVLFAVAVVIGIASGQSAVALGMAAAPLLSLLVVPWFFARREAGDPPPDADAVKQAEGGLTLRHGVPFAAAVLVVMIAEQTLLNAAVLTVEGTSADAALAGIVFSVLLIARAPLQLFQAVQGSLLPHLAGLQATAGAAEFRRAIRVTVLAIGAFALAVALGLFAVGPPVVEALFDIDRDIGRAGLALVGLGMGFHLVAGTLNQAALARGHALGAALAWLVCAGAFVAWMLTPAIDDQLLRTEVGYCCATGLLAALLAVLYRAGDRRHGVVAASPST
ncbi:MAG: lipopolysaccharide biosynthesis protein [Thermoleophilia bacterium]